MAVEDWSAKADSNGTIDGINIAEHCPAKNLNDAIRAVMANIKTYSTEVKEINDTQTTAIEAPGFSVVDGKLCVTYGA